MIVRVKFVMSQGMGFPPGKWAGSGYRRQAGAWALPGGRAGCGFFISGWITDGFSVPIFGWLPACGLRMMNMSHFCNNSTFIRACHVDSGGLDDSVILKCWQKVKTIDRYRVCLWNILLPLWGVLDHATVRQEAHNEKGPVSGPFVFEARPAYSTLALATMSVTNLLRACCCRFWRIRSLTSSNLGGSGLRVSSSMIT